MRQFLLASLLLAAAAARTADGSPLTFLRDRAQDEDEERAIIEDNQIDRDVVGTSPVVITQKSRTAGKGKNRFQIANKEWVQMSKSPPGAVSVPSRSRIELECEAMGSPAPRIYWLKGSDPLRQFQLQLNELVGNSVAEVEGSSTSWGSVARTRSKLVIDCASPRDQGLVHCVAVSGSKTISSDPTMLLVNELEKGNGSSCGLQSKPRVTMYSPIMMSPIGSTVVLPCRASGRPRPRTIWLDNDERPVTPLSNPRFKVMPGGELVIYLLEWSDMGGFTCIARSDQDEDAATTFLYPILTDNDRS